ncbi:hypothetical protein NHX12_014613 [Muraenolepis orangiensis]|uniref:Uncharacterized protein n=1 Tax=Muraenolepis orangiensis TaxID=630683 RepID=A0A9Q0DCI3_9TELE|nr:hypothetical protein NHX12_014613 [Muraenolepis orangiensis]
MAALTETEIKEISKLSGREAVRRLAGHFAWREFECDVLRHFHQRFVHDVARFAWTRGFPWSDVVRAAAMAKDVFPQLTGVGVARQLDLLGEARSRRLPHLTPLHRGQLSRYLADACVGSHRPLAAALALAVSGANTSTERRHLKVQVPPRPLPLAQGMTLEEAELQRRQAELTTALGRTEHRLQALRDAPRVTAVAEVDASGRLNAEGVQEWARAAASQAAAALRQEAALVAELLELRLQCAVSADRERHSPAASPRATPKQTRQPRVAKGRKK